MLQRRASRAGSAFVESGAYELLARMGFAARGIVYGIVGLLALGLAVGIGGRATDQQGALRTVAHQPFGEVLVALLAFGLAGYAVWRLTRAALGHGRTAQDSGWKRIGALCSGLAYAGLCAFAIELLLHRPSGGSTNPDEATAGVLGWPGGTWLVGMAGLVALGVAAGQVYIGAKQTFLRDAEVGRMSSATRRWFGHLGTIGHLARGVVFGLVGVFLIKAAVEYDPKESIGLDGALAKLAGSGHGPVLLGIVAAGLLAFAAYSLAEARYHRI